MSNETSQDTPKNSKSISEQMKLLNLLDPRSPTTAFQRTPIQVITQTPNTSIHSIEEMTDTDSVEALQNDSDSYSLNSTFANELDDTIYTSNSSSSFISADSMDEDENITSCSPSPVVSDLNLSGTFSIKDESSDITKTPETKNSSELIDLVNCTNDKISNDSFVDCDSNVKVPAKKLFFTPNTKRTPLGAVDNVCPVTPPLKLSSSSSPHNVLRQKQWKRIQEERKKLGLESDENVPLPLFDVTASAPSKLTLRKMRLQNRI